MLVFDFPTAVFHFLLAPLAALCMTACTPASPTLRERLEAQTRGLDASIGIAVLTPEGALTTLGNEPLPLLSLFKFPLAVAVLDHTRRHGIPLAQRVKVTPDRLDPDTWSPLRDSLPPAGGAVSLGELLRLSVAKSDNIACDLLLDLIGGPAALDAWLRENGCEGFVIRVDERTMHADPATQRLNTARPSAVVRLFERLLRGDLLPEEETALLRRLLETCATGADKLRAGLPDGTTLGHKTGNSDRIDGRRIADNDAGYFLLPDGRSCCIAVLATDSGEEDATNAGIAAEAARTTYFYLTERKTNDR